MFGRDYFYSLITIPDLFQNEILYMKFKNDIAVAGVRNKFGFK